MIDLSIPLFLAAALFAIGSAIVFTRRNPLLLLCGIELMLNAANLNLVAFSRLDAGRAQGQILSLFIMLIAACETAVFLAVLYLSVRRFAGRKAQDPEKVV